MWVQDLGCGTEQASGTVTPLDINEASIGELKAALMIKETDARQIVNGRPYRGLEELARKKVVSKALCEKIKSRIIAGK